MSSDAYEKLSLLPFFLMFLVFFAKKKKTFESKSAKPLKFHVKVHELCNQVAAGFFGSKPFSS